MLKNKILWIGMLSLIIFTACSESTSEEDERDTDDESNPPSVHDLDPDAPLTSYIEDGEELVNSTTLTDEQGSELSCMSCHADGGLTNNLSLAGVTEKYPAYSPREGTVVTLQERINESIVRTLNGEKLEYDGEEMRSIIAYLTHISDRDKVRTDTEENTSDDTIVEIPEPDLENGEKLYEERIADSSPPLWGEQSFTDGSSMSRMSVMTNFVKHSLPENDPGSLSDQEAADVAAFILAQERPEWENHDADWPDEDRPGDIITEAEREEIREGNFDWSSINN